MMWIIGIFRPYIITWMPPKVSKGSKALPPPVAAIGRAQEAGEKEQCKRKRSNATIELAGPIGKPFGRVRRREVFYPKDNVDVTSARLNIYLYRDSKGMTSLWRGPGALPPERGFLCVLQGLPTTLL